MRKEQSSNNMNEQIIFDNCGTAFGLALIGGRWKPLIIWHLLRGKKRYSQLRDDINSISERMLVLHLKEMEKFGLVKRTMYPGVPPKVEYELTEHGLALAPLMQGLADWGLKQRQRMAQEELQNV
jgi:DNA-binding HxlR family transcriptional regulator